jgi:hypothetical protein
MYPDYFVPAVSVHPYKKDAAKELEKWAIRGARLIKWLLNSMGIDPSNKIIRPYYQVMKKYNMTLLSHTGEEKAVDAEEYQKWGNPLHFRYPLDLGVRVVILHCASLGDGEDFDDPKRNKISNFKLFTRMMNNPKYDNLLYEKFQQLLKIIVLRVF